MLSGIHSKCHSEHSSSHARLRLRGARFWWRSLVTISNPFKMAHWSHFFFFFLHRSCGEMSNYDRSVQSAPVCRTGAQVQTVSYNIIITHSFAYDSLLYIRWFTLGLITLLHSNCPKMWVSTSVVDRKSSTWSCKFITPPSIATKV